MANRGFPASLRRFVLVTSCSLLLSEMTVTINASATEPLKVIGIQAKLFFEGTGTFSGDVLADRAVSLWNTPIGEGSAGAPSSSTLILVEVTGPPNTTEHERRVSFTANYKSGIVNADGKAEMRNVGIKQVVSIGHFGQSGKSYVAFWLYDTGCTPVSVSAKITGQSQTPMEKTIVFRCGE